MQAFLLQEASQRYHVCVRASLNPVPEGRGRQILKRSAGQEFLYNECVTIHRCPVFDDQINQTAVLVGFGVRSGSSTPSTASSPHPRPPKS